ncbi:Uncharacterised protein [Sphingobacterium spiritivorum]|nr:Uncharacterised protein [Sphingobacterium spiritivorum]
MHIKKKMVFIVKNYSIKHDFDMIRMTGNDSADVLFVLKRENQNENLENRILMQH